MIKKNQISKIKEFKTFDEGVRNMKCPRCGEELKKIRLFFEISSEWGMEGDKLKEGWQDESPFTSNRISDEPTDAECALCGEDVMHLLDANDSW